MDNCYCLVNIIYNRSITMYYYYSNHHDNYPLCIKAKNSALVSTLICKHESFNNLSKSHYLYLGKELYKAELSLVVGQHYIQS